MPKAKTAGESSKERARLDPKLIVLVDGDTKLVMPRPKSHAEAIVAAKKHLPCLKEREFTLCTDSLPSFEDELVEITSDVWDDVVPTISSLIVKVSAPPPPLPLPRQTDVQVTGRRKAPPRRPKLPPVKLEGGKMRLNVVCYSGRTQAFIVSPSTPISKIMRATVLELWGKDNPEEIRFLFAGSKIDPKLMVHQVPFLQDGDTIQCAAEQIGGKPVIYLFPPKGKTVEANVSLKLSREWEFSAVYPPAPVVPVEEKLGVASESSRSGQEVKWSVLVQPGGELLDIDFGLSCSYLFWEARTYHPLLLSPPTSRSSTPTIDEAPVFSPSTCDLAPQDSVFLQIRSVPVYLDQVLRALDLHVEARTSFITYWLPSLLKHQSVALRFVSQAAYEHAASLTIDPEPQVVQRVFMLFKGVDGADASLWDEAADRAKDNVRFWREVVGLQGEPGELMGNEKLFRALEWGGMEVVR